MRRLTLAVFFCLAACGGAVSSGTDAANRPVTDMKGDRWAVLMSADGAAVVESFKGSVSQEALDGCIDSWLGSDGSDLMPAQKPSAVGLRAFLRLCLSRPEPGGFHADPGDGSQLRTARDTGI